MNAPGGYKCACVDKRYCGIPAALQSRSPCAATEPESHRTNTIGLTITSIAIIVRTADLTTSGTNHDCARQHGSIGVVFRWHTGESKTSLSWVAGAGLLGELSMLAQTVGNSGRQSICIDSVRSLVTFVEQLLITMQPVIPTLWCL